MLFTLVSTTRRHITIINFASVNVPLSFLILQHLRALPMLRPKLSVRYKTELPSDIIHKSSNSPPRELVEAVVAGREPIVGASIVAQLVGPSPWETHAGLRNSRRGADHLMPVLCISNAFFGVCAPWKLPNIDSG
jgi:hypothetical protein